MTARATPPTDGEPGETKEDSTPGDDLSALALPARRALRETGLRAKKGLGQNFLVDRTVPPRIVSAAGIEPDDFIVEVGPGLGILTDAIASGLDPTRGKLVAIELDDNLVPLLRERFAGQPHVSIVHGDVLEIPPEEIVRGRPYKVVANLPYYITSAVLRHFLEAPQKPLSLTVMVQREVAERIVAQPPDMGLLSVAVQFYGKPKVAFRVPPGAFHPAPKVESAVVNIALYPPGEGPVTGVEEESFFRVVRAGFSQKRKQIANTLSSALHLSKSDVTARLIEAGIDPSRRAETLGLPEWARVEKGLGASSE